MHAPDLLLVKTSSMGDVLHNLPAVTDILSHFPEARIDWAVEESFAALPALHPGIHQVVPVAIRRWRRGWLAARHEMRQACHALHAHPYDLVIDTQGLLKSALIARCAQGVRCGYDWGSAREPLASLFYQRKFAVPRRLHAVERNRLLAAAALGYEVAGPPVYGLTIPNLELAWLGAAPYVVFLHATSRDNKLWLEDNWIALGRTLHERGLRAVLTWGTPAEQTRAARLCALIPDALMAPRLNLPEAATLLGRAQAVVGVDTGLSHLAAALDVPTIGLYTATDPGLTGLHAGARAINLGGKMQQPAVTSVLENLANMGLHV
ncbi:MAG: lipopolysaccharide heptosyltransferase I [Pseudomonadota bacterium]